MKPSTKTPDKKQPSEQFCDFACVFGPVLRAFDPFAELLLLPPLVAVRERATSLNHWTNGMGMKFNAQCHYLESIDMDGYAGGKGGSYYLSICGGIAYAMSDLFSVVFSIPTFSLRLAM